MERDWAKTILFGEGNEVYGLDIMLRGNKENISDLEGDGRFNFFETSILDETSLEMSKAK